MKRQITSPWVLLGLAGPWLAGLAGAAALTAGDATCLPGGEVSIPVRIDDATDLLAADLTLTFDPSVLAPVDAAPSGLGSGFDLARALRWDRVTISLARAKALAGGSGTLALVTLRALDDAPPGPTRVSVASATAYGASRARRALDVAASDGTVTVQSPSDSGGSGGGGGGGGCFLRALSR